MTVCEISCSLPSFDAPDLYLGIILRQKVQNEAAGWGRRGILLHYCPSIKGKNNRLNARCCARAVIRCIGIGYQTAYFCGVAQKSGFGNMKKLVATLAVAVSLVAPIPASAQTAAAVSAACSSGASSSCVTAMRAARAAGVPVTQILQAAGAAAAANPGARANPVAQAIQDFVIEEDLGSQLSAAEVAAIEDFADTVDELDGADDADASPA